MEQQQQQSLSSTTTAAATGSKSSPTRSTGGCGSGPGSGAAVEALALLKVVATQLQGPSGAALRKAIANRAVSDHDVQKVAGLAMALAGLVEPQPVPLPSPPALGRTVSAGGGSISSSGLTTLASTDSLLSSMSSASSMLLMNEVRLVGLVGSGWVGSSHGSAAGLRWGVGKRAV